MCGRRRREVSVFFDSSILVFRFLVLFFSARCHCPVHHFLESWLSNLALVGLELKVKTTSISRKGQNGSWAAPRAQIVICDFERRRLRGVNDGSSARGCDDRQRRAQLRMEGCAIDKVHVLVFAARVVHRQTHQGRFRHLCDGRNGEELTSRCFERRFSLGNSGRRRDIDDSRSTNLCRAIRGVWSGYRGQAMERVMRGPVQFSPCLQT